MNRKICVFIGSRANYSSIKSVMTEIKNGNDMELILFVGASALLDKYGEVVDLIEADGFDIHEKIYTIVEGETPLTMAKSAGLTLVEHPGLLKKYDPDFTVIVGDRFEMLTATIASTYLNIPVAHTMGGEVSGTIDESIRHAITKLSHVHFSANELAKNLILRMGENPDYVFNVGCPRIDLIKDILSEKYDFSDINTLIKNNGVGGVFDISKENYLLVSQHPVTTEFGQGEKQIHETLMAVKDVQEEYNKLVIMLWPNSDAGSDDVARGIRKFRERYDDSNFHFFKNLPINMYVHLMANTLVLVGNSSSGIREGAFIGTPVVNIGSRQSGRMQGKNVIDVEYDREEIKEGIKKQIEHGKYESEPIYGNGTAGKKIADILKTIDVPIQKKFHY